MNNMQEKFAGHRLCFYILFYVSAAVLHFFVLTSFYHFGCHNDWFCWRITLKNEGPELQWSGTVVSKNKSAYFSTSYFVTCHGFFLGIKCLELQGVSLSYIFLCILQVNKKKKKVCLFISLLVLASGWSCSSLGGRDGGGSGRKLLLMSASSKLPSPCSPVTTIMGKRKIMSCGSFL